MYEDIVSRGEVSLQGGRPYFFNADEQFTGPPCYSLPCAL